MDDDLDIGTALASLFDFVREINNLLDANMVSKQEAADVGGLMMRIDEVLGVIGKVEVEEALPADIDALVQKREEARKAKNWKEADAIRAQLKAMGIVLEDTAQGVRWHKEKSLSGFALKIPLFSSVLFFAELICKLHLVRR